MNVYLVSLFYLCTHFIREENYPFTPYKHSVWAIKLPELHFGLSECIAYLTCSSQLMHLGGGGGDLGFETLPGWGMRFQIYIFTFFGGGGRGQGQCTRQTSCPCSMAGTLQYNFMSNFMRISGI